MINLALEFTGLLNGVSALSVLVISIIIGLFSYYKSYKLKAKLLSYAAINIIFIGLLWLGPTTDFLFVLITGANLPGDPPLIYPILSYMWVAPSIFFAMTIGTELLIPEKKWYLLSVILVLSILFEVLLFGFTASSFTFDLPSPVGSDIIDTSFIYPGATADFPWGLTFILIAVFLILNLLFNGIGFFRKALQASGVIRKKFIYLSLGFTIFTVASVFDSLIPPGILLPFVRISVVISSLLMFYGLKS